MPELPQQPDPTKPFWAIRDIAAYWGLPEKTVKVYRERTRRGEGHYLPDEDDKIGNRPVWKPQTIIAFQRPGQGSRTDLQNQPPDQPGSQAADD